MFTRHMCMFIYLLGFHYIVCKIAAEHSVEHRTENILILVGLSVVRG